jgi:hypothetical protein
MVLVNASKNARNAASLINRNQGGGPKKCGVITLVGHPSNVYFALQRQIPRGNPNLPVVDYGSTVKGRVGAVAPFF